MREGKFSKKVVMQLESQTAFIINLHGHMMQKSGLPDLEIIHRRWTGFLELKCEKRKATVLQRNVAKKIKLRGTPAFVLRCVERSVETPQGNRWLIGENLYTYTIENFEKDIYVIKTFNNLCLLLDILVELNNQ